MNKAMLGVGIIIMGIVALIMINIFTNYSTGGELDYYLLKETTQASIEDAIDEDFKISYGLPRIDQEKFVESFLRRFAENVDETRTYNIKFIDINEIPPKVSVKINSNTVLTYNNEETTISTQIDQIVETNAKKDAYTKALLD